MACHRPNLQNLPRDREYRSCFQPASGNVLVKADYSQIELRIVAEMAGDIQMVSAFKEGQDLHLLTAMQVTGQTNPEAITGEQRQLAKAMNFGLIYGMGAERLANYANSPSPAKLAVNPRIP